METGAGTLGAPRSPGEERGERGDQLQSRARFREGLFAQVGVRPSGRWLEVEKPRVHQLLLSEPAGKGCECPFHVHRTSPGSGYQVADLVSPNSCPLSQ